MLRPSSRDEMKMIAICLRQLARVLWHISAYPAHGSWLMAHVSVNEVKFEVSLCVHPNL